mmetsp:Transcript_5184/g.14967  ORF Transcript_5184/g.14967 Transcript_5184/m.14967 type:complete len:140 (+) Transcript_5184:2418-2837(+)
MSLCQPPNFDHQTSPTEPAHQKKAISSAYLGEANVLHVLEMQLVTRNGIYLYEVMSLRQPPNFDHQTSPTEPAHQKKAISSAYPPQHHHYKYCFHPWEIFLRHHDFLDASVHSHDEQDSPLSSHESDCLLFSPLMACYP